METKIDDKKPESSEIREITDVIQLYLQKRLEEKPDEER